MWQAHGTGDDEITDLGNRCLAKRADPGKPETRSSFESLSRRGHLALASLHEMMPIAVLVRLQAVAVVCKIRRHCNGWRARGPDADIANLVLERSVYASCRPGDSRRIYVRARLQAETQFRTCHCRTDHRMYQEVCRAVPKSTLQHQLAG